jgi:hypothetical protein
VDREDGVLNVNVNELRLGFSNTTRNPEDSNCHGVCVWGWVGMNLNVGQVALMGVVNSAVAALDAHMGVPSIADNGRVFLYNLAVVAANLPALRAAGVKELMTRILALHPSHPTIAERAHWLIARL